MAREKTSRLIITFSTTTAAMAMESVCRPGDGRLIPIPAEISAGCGLAWCAEPRQQTDLVRVMAEHQIAYQSMDVIEMY